LCRIRLPSSPLEKVEHRVNLTKKYKYLSNQRLNAATQTDRHAYRHGQTPVNPALYAHSACIRSKKSPPM
ncbi:MAG TPA: hypothetical protein P5333_24900, partial [Caldilinea sp.]|nr:hypothetical protein [Caldilinea sp.]